MSLRFHNTLHKQHVVVIVFYIEDSSGHNLE
jgi:hypothetical protein